jgi:hypothetical protein
MDKKFGAPWNCVLGQYYSFEITAEVGGGAVLNPVDRERSKAAPGLVTQPNPPL